MNTFKVTLDTRHQNGVIGPITQFDNATLELQILTGGQVTEPWNSPEFELIAMKRDMNPVREVDQGKFTVISKEDRTVQIALKEQFLTCRGTVKMQLVVKDGSRTSTTIFYLSIAQSLDHTIVESIKDIKVLDDLDEVVESLGVLEVTATNNEEKRQENEKLRELAESNRQDEFKQAQNQRDTDFNEKMEEYQEYVSGLQGIQGKPGETPQIQVNETHIQFKYPSQQQWTDLVALESLKGPEGPIGSPGIQGKTGEPGKDGDNGKDGQDGITPNFTIGTVTTLEPGQQATVTKRGTKENPILDIAIPRGADGKDGQGGGSGVEDSDKVDYMGAQHESLKEKADADIEYLLRKFGTQHYEGTNITATDTYMKRVKSAKFKGVTKYRDKDTGEIIGSFQEGKNLELISVKSPVLIVAEEKGGIILLEKIQRNKWVSLSGLIENTPMPLGVYEDYVIAGEKYIYTGINKCKNFVTSTEGGRQTYKFGREGFYTEPNRADTIIVAGNYTGEIFITVDLDNLDKIRFKNVKDDTIDGESTTLTTPQDLILRGVGDVYDTLDLNTGEYIQRIETRPYQQGDESNAEVLTDKVNTVYKLAQPITTKIDLKGQKVYSYDKATKYITKSLDGHPAPILSIDVPTNTTRIIARQREIIETQQAQIQTLEVENERLIVQNEVQDVDIALNQDAINFMLFAPATMALAEHSKGVNAMAAYLANQILKGRLDYTLVVSRYEEFKEEIDTILIGEGKQDLIK